VQSLGIDDVLVIASLVLDLDPHDLAGATKVGPLDSALHAPFAGYGDQDVYEEPWRKAAVLGARLVANHPFPDGNKRVAFLAMLAFARLNGCTWLPPDDSGPMIERLAAGQVDEDAFARWVAEHWTDAAS
jgi:death-on-curing protein